jgi:hypothetical protein
MNLLKHRLCALAAGAALAVPGVAGAATDLVANGSFENVPFSLGSGSFCYTGLDCAGAVPSWSGAFVLMQSTSSPWSATPNTPADQYHVGLQGDGSYFEQQISFAAPGFYQLSWYDAGRSNISGNQIYAASLAGMVSSNFTTTGQAWGPQSFLFYVDTAGVQTLRFQGYVAGDNTTFIDNISLVSAVPEPSTWAMAIAGLAASVAVARRRRT